MVLAGVAAVSVSTADAAWTLNFDAGHGFDGCDGEGMCTLKVSDTPIKGVADTGDVKISSTDGNDFVFQYEIDYPEGGVTCQGSYIKLISAEETGEVTPSSRYSVMFGPDKCGYDNNKIHFIYQIKNPTTGEYKEVWADVSKEGLDDKLYNDGKVSLLTLIIKDDDTWIIKIDNEEFDTGKLCDDEKSVEGHYCSEPENIPDETSTKPEDWVDETEIQDPEDTQPEDWVTEAEIMDPEATQPEDWDTEMDGDWEAPLIENPDFKGDYEFKKIENPAYKGEWVQATVANPAYVAELPSAQEMMDTINRVAIDVTANTEGVTMDDLFLANSADAVALAAAEAESNWASDVAVEVKEAEEAAAAAAAAKEVEDAAAAAAAAAKEEEDAAAAESSEGEEVKEEAEADATDEASPKDEL
jgi:calreticulin